VPSFTIPQDFRFAFLQDQILRLPTYTTSPRYLHSALWLLRDASTRSLVIGAFAPEVSITGALTNLSVTPLLRSRDSSTAQYSCESGTLNGYGRMIRRRGDGESVQDVKSARRLIANHISDDRSSTHAYVSQAPYIYTSHQPSTAKIPDNSFHKALQTRSPI
jgi:hypothetical protein